MTKDIDQHRNRMSILFFISCLSVALGDKFLAGTSYFILQVIAYILIIYSIYSGKIFSKKLSILFIISCILMIIGEVGSFISS